MIRCGAALRQLGKKSSSMEEVAQRVVRYLYDHFLDEEAREPACALVRFFRTYRYEELDPALQRIAEEALCTEPPTSEHEVPDSDGDLGDLPAWQDRSRSAGHQVIPLPSEEVVSKIPMIAQLIRQFGLEISTVVEPDPELLLDKSQESCNVFYVPSAVGSPYVPAQEDFVVPYGIQSVLGFGGVFPSGDLFALVLFSKVHIPRAVADMFETLALNVKMAALPFMNEPVSG